MITQTVQKLNTPAVAGPAPVLAGPGITHSKFATAFAGTLEQKAERDWRDICQRASDGGYTSGDCVPADADRLMQVCAFLARSMQDFNTDVATLNQIRNLQSQLVADDVFKQRSDDAAGAQLDATVAFYRANAAAEEARRLAAAADGKSAALKNLNLEHDSTKTALLRLRQAAPRLFPLEAAR
jgi:hypothetical protein